jgi:hypothetical protein
MPISEIKGSTVPLPLTEDPLEQETLDAIRNALRGLQFGQVVVIVQDGVVVQVDRTDRRRLRSKRSPTY